MNENEAVAALTAVEEANRELANVMTHAPWRHALFGLLEGTVVLGMGLAEPYCWIAYALALAVAVTLFLRERAIRGVLATVLIHRSRTEILIAMVAVLIVAGWINSNLAEAHASLAVRCGVAIVASLLLAGASVLVNRRFVADLQDFDFP
ncbi:MAG: hypothetical protein JSR96_05905 [Proteobacteria bacterium]|nr:hypothetical protein [Pseudomonadota bacterium]